MVIECIEKYLDRDDLISAAQIVACSAEQLAIYIY